MIENIIKKKDSPKIITNNNENNDIPLLNRHIINNLIIIHTEHSFQIYFK